MVFTKVKSIVRDKQEGEKDTDSLTIDEAIIICKTILETSCPVYVYGGDKKNPYGAYGRDERKIGASLAGIKRRIEKMLEDEKPVIIIYDNRDAKIKEGTVERWKTEKKIADNELPSPWMTR